MYLPQFHIYYPGKYLQLSMSPNNSESNFKIILILDLLDTFQELSIK